MLNEHSSNESRVLFLQQRLIRSIFTSRERFPKHLIDAFYAVPRHLFAEVFFINQKRCELDENSFEKLLPRIYEDTPLVIFQEFDKEKGLVIHSTISQPSLVLRMLQWLDVKEGHRVLEIGGGSGWNAALLGYLVGENGKVVSIEIFKELVERSQKVLKRNGFDKNVLMIHGDGSKGFKEFSPYDRAIFTAGSNDLPEIFYSQLKNQSILLLVLKNIEDSDRLFVLKKKNDHFVSHSSMAVRFVPLQNEDALIEHNEFINPLTEFKKRFPYEIKSAANFDFNSISLEIFHLDAEIKTSSSTQWLVKRGRSQFLWSLKDPYRKLN